MTPVLLIAVGMACSSPSVSMSMLQDHVLALAADSVEGRGLETPGISLAAAYLRRQLRDLGFAGRPTWCGPDTVRTANGTAVNVIGSIGPDTAMVALCAHYDHLGVSVYSSGLSIFNGAHDNASGLAVVLEAARILSQNDSLHAGLVVCLFSGEEQGLIGSRGFLHGVTPAQIRAALVVDAVGHLDSTLMVIGGQGQSTFDSIFSIVLVAQGIRATRIPELQSGDHVAFLEQGIPALGVSTGPHALMNTTGDDPATLDYAGLAAVTNVVVATVGELSAHRVSLSNPPRPEHRTASGRKARLGTIPDHTSIGPGMRVAGVMPETPAAMAGIRPGDVIVGLSGHCVDGLADLARILAQHEPGDSVTVEFHRDGIPLAVDVVLGSRQ